MLTKNSHRFRNSLVRYSRHIVPIILLILIEMSTKISSIKGADLKIYIIYYVFDIAYFYLVTLGYMPLIIYWFQKRRLLQDLFAALAIPIFGITLIFYSAGITYLLNGKASFHLDFETIQRSSMRGILISALAYAVAYARAKIKADKLTSQQQLYALQLENNILNLQTNPHLINNVLSYLSERIEGYSTGDSKAIILLSELTSDSLKPTDDQGKIAVKDDLGYILKYIELEALYREKEPFRNLKIDIKGSELLTIAPKLLLDPVVNLLKYGDFQNIEKQPFISISIKDNILYMETYNAKNLLTLNRGHYIGINNLKQRLKLNYPNKHQMQIEENELEYRLTLIIELC